MPTSPLHVDALLTFDPSRQSCTKPFYIKTLKPLGITPAKINVDAFLYQGIDLYKLMERCDTARTPAALRRHVRTLLETFPACGTALMHASMYADTPQLAVAYMVAVRELALHVLKRMPQSQLDPELEMRLCTIGFDQLLIYQHELGLKSEVLEVVMQHTDLMPVGTAYVLSTLMRTTAAFSVSEMLFDQSCTLVRTLMPDFPDIDRSILLAEIVFNVRTRSTYPALSSMVERFNALPPSRLLKEEIDQFVAVVPELSDVLTRRTTPPTDPSIPSSEQLAEDDVRARELSILASSLTGTERDECLALAANQYPHSLWTWLGHVYHAKNAAEQLMYANKGLACAPIMNADLTTTPFVDLLAGKGRALFALGEYDAAFEVMEQLFMMQTADVTEMYEPFLSMLIAKGPEHFDRAELIIRDMIEIGNYYPALPWLQLLMQIVQQRPADVINSTLTECLNEMPWVGLLIAGYQPMESSRDPGLPNELDIELLSITVYIVHFAYVAYPKALQQLRTLLR